MIIIIIIIIYNNLQKCNSKFTKATTQISGTILQKLNIYVYTVMYIATYACVNTSYIIMQLATNRKIYGIAALW